MWLSATWIHENIKKVNTIISSFYSIASAKRDFIWKSVYERHKGYAHIITRSVYPTHSPAVKASAALLKLCVAIAYHYSLMNGYSYYMESGRG